jgi:1-acyl-sn-glycerol-3-phosphate acyltransferase
MSILSSTTLDLSQRPAVKGGLLRFILMAIIIAPWTAFWGSLSMLVGSLKWVGASTFCTTFWGRGLLFVSGVRIKIHDHSGLPPERTCIYLANHQSALDIPVLMRATMGRHVRFLAKEELFKIPFIGWGMKRTGYIPIRRDNPRHSAEIFKQLTSTKTGAKFSYVIFPEGTRSSDGRMQPLKAGSIGLALRLGYPIVPVSIVDACRANPKNVRQFRSGTVQVVFHPAIEIPEPSDDQKAGRELRDTVKEKVYAAILSALPEDQRPVAP